MDYLPLLIILPLALLLLLWVRHRRKNKPADNKLAKKTEALVQEQRLAQVYDTTGSNDWMNKVDLSALDAETQDWEWGSDEEEVDIRPEAPLDSLSTQSVDYLTEYQVYRQFGYEGKAAEALSAYLKDSPANVNPQLANDLAGLSLSTGNADLLAESLERYAYVLQENEISEYIRAGLMTEPTHLRLRVLAEKLLGWDVQEVANQIGEQAAAEEDKSSSVHNLLNSLSKRPSMVLGKAALEQLSSEEMGAVIGFSKPEQSARILKDQVGYEAALKQYNKAIQSSPKPAALIIDALKLDYQHAEINEFARHLWKLYATLGQYGRQVKERMLGWGYSLGRHEIFDDLEKSPDEQTIRHLGEEYGYTAANHAVQGKVQYRDLVQKDSISISEDFSPAEELIKEAESLLMYGQTDQAMATLESAVLQYPYESQLYIMLFDIYERAEDWSRMEQFLNLLRERTVGLPEEVALAVSLLWQKINRHSKTSV